MREGWRQVRLGEVFELSNTKLGPHAVEPQILSLSKYDGFVHADKLFDKRIASASLDGYKTVAPDEWAFSTIHIDEGSIARNHLGVVGAISPMYTTLRWVASEHHPGFFELLLRSPGLLRLYAENAQGSINRRRSLPFGRFADLVVEVPPLAVQRRIVDLIGVLDSEISRRDQEASRLGRVAQALASRAWMHGLRAGSPTTLGDVAQFVRNGVMYKRGDATGGLPVTRIETMSAGEIDLERVGYIGLDESTGSEFLLAAGDILFSNKNSLERVGTTALVAPEHLPLINGDNVLQIRLREQAVPEFVLALLRSTECREYIRSVTRPAVNQASVNAAQVRAIPLWMPDLSAQAEWGGAYVESLRLLRGLRENQRAASLLRERLLQNLLFGAIEIPSTCDALLGEVA
jgi:hypothetical protein